MRRILRPLGYQVLRAPAVRRATAAAAAIRGHGLVLVFHRITVDGEPSGGVVPAVPQEVFRRQLEEIREVGDIVPLTSLLEETQGRGRPRFAITFDDDYLSHHEVALPILLEQEVPATFFIAGRSLHDLGPHWFEILDSLLVSHDVAEVRRRLGIENGDLQHLTQQCERDPRLQRIIQAQDATVAGHLTAAHISALVDAGMTIGFHTLHHRLLTGMANTEVDAALIEGRAELEGVIGDRLHLFAYPHGKADGEIAMRVQESGFVAAWTGLPHAVAPRDDRYLLGRWEAGPVHAHVFVARLLARLHRSAGA